MNIAILGATRGMGKSLARAAVLRGDNLALFGRNNDQLQRSASDLKIRAPESKITTALCDLCQPDTFTPALELACRELGRLDVVIVTAGVLYQQTELEQDAELTREMLTVNFTNTVLFCESARQILLDSGGGTLCVFSSVAGERARKPVVLYGAAKAGLSAYLEGLDHKFKSRGLRTVCVLPGFVKTTMTEGLKPPPFSGEPDLVAQQVLKAIDRGAPVVYAPRIWRLIMLVIRCLPRSVMRRLEF